MALLTKSIAFVLLVLAMGSQAHAIEVSFPADELPSEVVVPILDSREPVKSRIVKMKERFDAQVGFGYLLDEPFYKNQFFSVGMLFHPNEKIGFGLSYLAVGSGLSDYGTQFGKTGNQLNLSKAPSLKSAISAVFQYQFMYGKISWTKDTITPVSYHSQGEISWASYGSKNLPWLSAGVGQRIFFDKNWGTDLTMKLMYRQQIDPLSKSITGTSAPSESEFGSKYKLGADIRFGLYYLL